MSGDPSAGSERTSKSGRAAQLTPNSTPTPRPSPPPSTLAPTQQRLTAALPLAGGGARRGARGGSRAGTPRPHLPHSLAASMCTACPLHALCTLTARSHCAHTAYDCAHCPPARPPARRQTANRPLQTHCAHAHTALTLRVQVRLIQRALLGEETHDEALEETGLVTPVKKKGGRHVRPAC